MTPDENPFIDKHPNYANIIMASGFSGKIMVKTLHLPVHVLFCARQLCCCTPFAIMKVYKLYNYKICCTSTTTTASTGLSACL